MLIRIFQPENAKELSNLRLRSKKVRAYKEKVTTDITQILIQTTYNSNSFFHVKPDY